MAHDKENCTCGPCCTCWDNDFDMDFEIPKPPTTLDVSPVVDVDIESLVSICDKSPGVIMRMLHVVDKHIKSKQMDGGFSHANANQLQAEIYKIILPTASEFVLERARILNSANAERDRVRLEYYKFPLEYDKLRMEYAKLKMEYEKHRIQKLLLCIQAELQKNQAKAFKYGHLYKVLKLLIDTVTVANTQEIADIFAGPNKIFEGLHPHEWFEAAWNWEKELEYTGGTTADGNGSGGCSEGCECQKTATTQTKAFVPNVDAVIANIEQLKDSVVQADSAPKPKRTIKGKKATEEASVDETPLKP